MTISIHKASRGFFVDSVKSNVWDAPPMVFLQKKGNDKMMLCLLEGIDTIDFLRAIERREPVVMAQLGDLPRGVQGLAVHGEGWALKKPTPADLEWVQTHSIADHPRGCEVKTLVSYDGKMFQSLTLFRGDDEPTEERGKALKLGGRMPSALSGAFEELNRL